MGKVFKLTELVLENGSVYTVGGIPAHFPNGETAVSEIAFNREDNAFNKGLQVAGASYTVAFDNSPERRIIPETTIVDFGGMWVENVAKVEKVPDLPDA